MPHAGNFTVNGTVKDTDLKVEVTVMVVSGEAQNVALIATPSAIIGYTGGSGRSGRTE